MMQPQKPAIVALYIIGIYICIRSYDTGPNFKPIFMKFARLVRVLSWVNPTVFGNNRPNRTSDMGENAPSKPVFWGLSQAV